MLQLRAERCINPTQAELSVYKKAARADVTTTSSSSQQAREIVNLRLQLEESRREVELLRVQRQGELTAMLAVASHFQHTVAEIKQKMKSNEVTYPYSKFPCTTDSYSFSQKVTEVGAVEGEGEGEVIAAVGTKAGEIDTEKERGDGTESDA